jgi:zinc protease
LSGLLAVSWLTGCAAGTPKPSLPAPAARPPAPAPAATSPAEPPFLDPAVLHGTLANGLNYYVLRREEPAGRAAVWLAVNTGSVLEDDDQRGLAHFVEHLAFTGTAHYPKRAILDFLERAGMRIGPDVNGGTSFDQTLYALTLPTDREGLLAQGLDVLRDIAQNVTFEPSDVEHERGIILEERRVRLGANTRARDERNPVLLAGSRYAVRDPIGLPETIRTASVATLRRFYDDWYRPNLMGVVAVGDFDAKAVEQAIVERFASLVNPPAPRLRPVFTVPHAGPPELVVHTDPELSTARVELIDRVDHERRESRDDYRHMLVDQLYFAIFGERLAELRDSPHSVLVKTGVGRSALTRTLDAYQYSFSPREGKLDNALYLVASELVRLARFGVLSAELERARKDVRARARASLQESTRAPPGRKASELVRHLFEREAVPGQTVELKWLDEILPTITLDEMNQFARARADTRGRVVSIDVPSGQPSPTKEGVLTMFRLAQNAELEPWRVTAPSGPLLASPPTPGSIVSRSHDAGADADVWELSNGVRVAAKHTDFSEGNVSIRGFQPGGTSVVSDADFLDARFAPGIVVSSGAGSFSQRDLRSFIAGTSIDVRIGLNELEQTIEAKARSDELALMFQYLYLRLTEPRAEEYAFEIWKEQNLETLRHRDDVPEERFTAEITRATTLDHPRRRRIEAAMLEHVDREKALAIWKRRFANFQAFTFVVVGRFDPSKLETLATTYLASLPTTREKPRFKDPNITYPTGVVERTIAGGVESKAHFWLGFVGPSRPAPHARTDALIFGRALELRLNDLLRYHLGGVYSLGVRAEVNRDPRPRHELVVQFYCAPDNVARLRQAVFDELAAIVQRGIGDDYLAKAREELRRHEEADRATDAWWLARLANAYSHGDDFAKANDLDAMLARVTNENLKKTAEALFDPHRYVLVVMQPGGVTPAPQSGGAPAPQSGALAPAREERGGAPAPQSGALAPAREERTAAPAPATTAH